MVNLLTFDNQACLKLEPNGRKSVDKQNRHTLDQMHTLQLDCTLKHIVKVN